MPRKRYRLPRGPRVSPPTYKIVRRDGCFLSNVISLPFTWTEREAMALSFRSRADAEAFISRRFISLVTARELSGIRVVRP